MPLRCNSTEFGGSPNPFSLFQLKGISFKPKFTLASISKNFQFFTKLNFTTALFHFKTKAMAEQILHFLIDEDQSMQTDPIYLFSDEDTTSKYAIHDEYSLKVNNTQIQTLSQIVVKPIDPRNTAQVKISTYNVERTHLSSSATMNSGPPLSRHAHNVSPASTSYSPQSGPNPIGLRQTLPTIDTTDSPMRTNRRAHNIFKPYILPETPPATNNHRVSNIKSIMQELQDQALTRPLGVG